MYVCASASARPHLVSLPQDWMQHQTVWLVEALDDGILEGAVQSSNVDLLLVAVVARPEQVSGDPVHSQAVSIGQICRWSTQSDVASFPHS